MGALPPPPSPAFDLEGWARMKSNDIRLFIISIDLVLTSFGRPDRFFFKKR